ncbi:5-methylcytosine-specific restriction enzyme B [Pedobacter terrae]|uniref:5-methylcytosine-specific restriction enzyme B n=1 Tax=Pedobacter terrae TaxID=405671 RepID=A0A1G7PRU0_9SPHI|nr:AAA family ATPase [Pedobacter terrae]SDF88934.1 5-methylcytosine-specific restriction enzyme B [Pedobacter terrae]
MIRDYLKPLYDTFDNFILSYIISKNSILTNAFDILSPTFVNEAITCFVENYDESSANFEDKVKGQFATATAEAKLNFAHAEWLWCFAVGDISQWRKEYYIFNRIGVEAKDLNPGIFPISFGHAGQWHTNNKYWEIVFCLRLIQVLDAYQKDSSVSDVKILKDVVEEFCNHLKYSSNLNKLKDYASIIEPLKGRKYAMSNILLYLANPDKHERIASDNHKQKIVNSFSSLEDDNAKENTIDERVLSIRAKISSLINDENFDFYDHSSIKKVWNTGDDDLEFDELQALLFKKAVVFYGPPGTSKTYKAKELAGAYILNQYIKDKSRLVEYLANPEDITKNRIHHLQLHANYTYENFIGGYLLKGGDTVLTQGSLMMICEKARKDLNNNLQLDIPHVLILDEMNRVDLSKLFGEVFSALEQRDYDISIGVEDLKVNIPRNLHIIGTMNEIDFSVEQIDFALRRRFLWFFYGYRPERLRDIIHQKANGSNSRVIKDDLERFYGNVKLLNAHIASREELGKMYEIGHAFFGDIVAIYNQYRNMKGYSRKSNFMFETNGPAQILWNISIKPILEAFLGHEDEVVKKNLLSDLEKIFLK